MSSAFFDRVVIERLCARRTCVSSDGLLALADFASLCRALFRNDQGKAYSISDKHLQEMFDVFDKNGVRLPAFLFACFTEMR